MHPPCTNCCYFHTDYLYYYIPAKRIKSQHYWYLFIVCKLFWYFIEFSMVESAFFCDVGLLCVAASIATGTHSELRNNWERMRLYLLSSTCFYPKRGKIHHKNSAVSDFSLMQLLVWSTDCCSWHCVLAIKYSCVCWYWNIRGTTSQ